MQFTCWHQQNFVIQSMFVFRMICVCKDKCWIYVARKLYAELKNSGNVIEIYKTSNGKNVEKVVQGGGRKLCQPKCRNGK